MAVSSASRPKRTDPAACQARRWVIGDHDRRNEAVAATPHIADHCLTRPIVADSPPGLFHPRGEVRLGNEAVAPHAVEQLRLGDHLVAAFEQVHEEVERLRFEMHRLTPSEQVAAADVELTVTEPVHAWHSPTPPRALDRRAMRVRLGKFNDPRVHAGGGLHW